MKRIGCRLSCVWILATVCVPEALGQAGPRPQAIPADAVTVLDGRGTCWRWVKAAGPALLAGEADAAGKRGVLSGKAVDAVDAADAGRLDTPVPANWADVDFGDADWPRTAGRDLENLVFIRHSMDVGTGGIVAYARNALLCLRARFAVADPAAVKALYLSVGYRGGVAVYLNGQEVARGHLPAGRLAASTAGAAYPDEAWLDPNGKLLPYPKHVKADDKEARRRIASRDRTLGPLALPVERLRKGVNVLAVEVHRSDLHPDARAWAKRYTRAAWTPLALTALRLAAVGGGLTPNTGRPKGLQVWNQDRNDRTTILDYGDPDEPLRPMVLAAGRNGTFSAKVVVSSDKAFTGLRAEASALTRDGGGTIPASAVRVRYSAPAFGGGPWMEPMSPAAPAKVSPGRRGGAVAAVWTTVRVPPTAAAGEYGGSLRVSAAGRKVADVPIRLHVADWTLPEPADFRTFVAVYQSPTALSLQYGVPEWSERHWRLMGRSFALLGGLGNKMVHLPIVDRTKMGNDRGMVTWVRKPDGSFDHDFGVVERYLKLVRKHMGVPRFVVLHVWHPGGWKAAGPKQTSTVTVRDPKTGQCEPLQVPEFGTPEAKAFWTPVLRALRDRLEAEGMADALVLGSLCETYPPQSVNRMFAGILAPLRWVRMTHASHGSLDRPNSPLPGGGKVACHVFTYLPGLPGPDRPLPAAHKGRWPRVAYFRRAQGAGLSLIGHRLLAAHSRLLGLPGFAHVCLDYWRCPKVSKHRGGMLYGHWLRAHNYPGDPEPAYLTWPGPDGAEPLTAYEAVREGLQEAEALIVLSEALAGGKLAPDLAGKCRRTLRDYLEYCRTRNQIRYQIVFSHMNHYGWQDLSRRLFDLAAEAASSAPAPASVKNVGSGTAAPPAP